ncbi:MAG: ABC transporter substrate-binding protein [Actinomycetota bacterium]|nr:ABC transporter substrate-binding protein [Actinomycetota bacterium]
MSTLLAAGLLLGFLVVLSPASASGAATRSSSIPIGALFDLTGPNSLIGQSDAAMAKKLIAIQNSHGGIHGRKINLIVLDSQTQPAVGYAEVKQLVEQDHIVAMLGPDFTSTAEVIYPYLDQQKVPTVADVGGGSWNNPAPPYFFDIPETDADVAEVTLGYMHLHGIKTLSWLGTEDGFGETGLAAFRQLAPKFGVKILPIQTMVDSSTDVTPQLTRLKQQHANAIMIYTAGAPTVVAQQDAAQLNIRTPLFQSNGAALPQFLQAAGHAANGVMLPGGNLQLGNSLPASNPQRPAIKRFLSLYHSANRFAGDMYDATTLLLRAMLAVGPNSQKIDAYLNHKVKNYAGVTGVMSFSPTIHAGISPTSLSILKANGGTFHLVQSGVSIFKSLSRSCAACLRGLPKS